MREEKLLELSVEDIQEVSMYDVRMCTFHVLNYYVKKYYEFLCIVESGRKYESAEFQVYKDWYNDFLLVVEFAQTIGLLSYVKSKEFHEIVRENHNRVLDAIFGGADNG